MKLTFEYMIVDSNIFKLERKLSDPSDQPLDVNLIQGLPSEHFEDEYIESNLGYTNQSFKKIFEDEYKDIILIDKLDQTTMSSIQWEPCSETLSVEPRCQLCLSIRNHLRAQAFPRTS